MKVFILNFILFALFSTSSFAQNYYLNDEQPLELTCDFSKSFQPSKQLTQLTKSKAPVFHCTRNDQTVEMLFDGVKITANQVEFNKQSTITLKCTGETESGMYLFGGYPIGYATKSSSKSPWFYKVDPRHTQGGRCSLEYNSKVIFLEAVMNKSMMVISPITI